MNQNQLNKYIERSRQRHIFKQFRVSLRYVIAPFYVAFGIVDYFYNSSHFFFWISLRVIFLASIWISFEFLKNKNIRQKYSEIIAILNISIACNIITVMIWQSGGVNSLYSTGLILVAMTGTQINRLDEKWALFSNLFSFIPAAIVVIVTSYSNNRVIGLVTAAFFLSMTFLAYIFRKSEDEIIRRWTIGKLDKDRQLDAFRRTEFMKNNFPKTLREKIERNELKIDARRVYPSAVVGFVDISGSTIIANTLTLLADWQLKEKFLECASQRAIASNLTVLSHLGDGLMYLANFNELDDWPLNILSFYEGLIKDFEQLNKSMGLAQEGLSTGLKFSLAMGPAVVGFLGSGQSYFTAMGPDVNLAARLCDRAQTNEMVVSSRVWGVLHHVMLGWDITEVTFNDLKSFNQNVPAVRITPRSMSSSNFKCTTCGSDMSIGRNSDGFIIAICPKENDHDALNIKINKVS